MPQSIANLFNGPKIRDICILANRTKTGENEKFCSGHVKDEQCGFFVTYSHVSLKERSSATEGSLNWRRDASLCSARHILVSTKFEWEAILFNLSVTITENEKFVRFIWETQEKIGAETNWLIYQKGGDYRTYYGNNNYIIKWSKPYTQYYRQDSNCRITDLEFTCLEALSYNSMGKQFSGRITPDICTYDVGGAALIGSFDNLLLISAVLNSQFGSYIIKAINDSINIQSSDVLEVPIPAENHFHRNEIINKARIALEIRKKLCSSELTEYNFTGVLDSSEIIELEKEFIDLKNSISRLVCESFGIEEISIPFQLPPETNYEIAVLEKNKETSSLLEQNVLSDR